MGALDDFITDDTRIPTMPRIAVEILKAVKKEDSSFDSLSQVVCADPSLSARVLKVANSSFYGLKQKVSTIPKALSILGLNTLKGIALSFVVVDSMRSGGKNNFDFEYFWRRAVTSAVAAESVCKATGRKYDEAFVGGLLQDIGIVVMYLAQADDYGRVLDEKRATGVPVAAAEKNIFGFDHEAVGGSFLEKWGLPPAIVEPIRYHHQNGTVPEQYVTQVSILQLADKLSAVYHGSQSVQCVRNITTVLQEQYGLKKTAAEALIDEVAQKSMEFFSLFQLGNKSIMPYSQLLEEANEQLAKQNLTYAQLAVQYKQEREKADVLAKELKDVNEKLRNLALIDSLTGLYNRRVFLTTIESELHRAQRYGRPFSLILLDVDNFKKINDTYGHRFGDLVLEKVGSILNDLMRNTDFVARYGGDEFGIILPETDVESAAITAERICRKIQECKVLKEKKPIAVTASLGVTDYTPGMVLTGINELFDIVDQALYESKKRGRNKVTTLRLSM